MSPGRAEKIFGRKLRHHLVLGRGMSSDDTELACFTAQSFLAHPDDADGFADALGWKLRLWLLGLPAGIGLATLRAAIKLWLGSSLHASGVWSAGNGPAIRSPILGLACWDDEDKLLELSQVSTRLTHTDPRAERGALAVALAARYASTHDPATFSSDALIERLASVFPEEDSAGRRWVGELGDGSPDFIRRLGCGQGISGYIHHTVPAALWVWLASPFDFRGGLERVIALGGDTDTTGAIFGGICGAATGAQGIPAEWLDGIWEFPRSVDWVRRLARLLHSAAVEKKPEQPLGLAWPLLPARNALFLAAILGHGFRRLLPPYS